MDKPEDKKEENVYDPSQMMEFLQGGWPGQDSPLRNEYLLKWHLVKNNILINELPTIEKKADVGLIR